jgi:hypothetical protein
VIPARRLRCAKFAAAGACLLVVLAVTLFASAPRAGDASASALRLEVQVAYGHEVGPESFRESLQRGLIRTIRQHGCFAEVARHDPEAEESGADLLLTLVIHDIEDRTEYDTTMAQRNEDSQRPNMPNSKQPMVVFLEATVDLVLVTLPDRIQIRSRDFREKGSFRPTYAQDARYEAEQLVLDTLARAGRKFVCKGAGRKLGQEIERARQGAQ